MSTDTALCRVLPVEEIAERFGQSPAVTSLTTSDLDKLMDICREELFQLAVNCAIRVKQLYLPQLDMTPLMPHIQKRDPHLIDSLKVLLGEDVLKDVFCSRCSIGNHVLASVLIAEVFPCDLYVGMITFADPRKPIPAEERKSVMQRFKGFGLLPEFVRRVEHCAKARDCQHITLVANETSQMSLFHGYGFSVDPYPVAAQAVANGRLIPMHKLVLGKEA